MLIKMIIEIIVLWLILSLFMWILVGRGRGPLGGIQYYPKHIQKRVVECGLMTEKDIRNQTICAAILLALIDIIVPFIMIYFINGGRSWWEFVWQWWVLFAGQTLYDWLAVDVYWCCYTDWWIIPEAKDLIDSYLSPKTMTKGKIKLYIISPVIALIFGGLCYGISLLLP